MKTALTAASALLLAAGLSAQTVNLPLAAIKNLDVGGNAGAPTFTDRDVTTSTIFIRMRDFASGAVRNNLAYLKFDLASLPPGALVQSAQMTLNVVAGNGSASTGRVALTGLLDLPGNLPQDWTAATFARGAEFDPTIFQDTVGGSGTLPFNLAALADFTNAENVNGAVVTLNSPAFAEFVQARLAGGAVTVLLTMPGQGGSTDRQLE